MQSVQQHSDEQAWYSTAWRALVKLDFIPAFFNWLMKALALLTEPFASFSAIYIIIVAGVPSLLNGQIYTAAMALIIGSPELLIVGAFKIASRELAQGNKKAWWLMAACGVLLLLTAITVGDLFVWHWDQGALNILMGVRCLAGIAYTFTRGVVTDDEQSVNLTPGSQVHSVLTEFTTSIQETVNSTVDRVNQMMILEVNRINAAVVAEVNQVRQFTLTEMQRVNQTTVAEVKHIVQEVNREQQHLLTLVNGVNQGVHLELQGAIETLGQQSQTALDAAVERLERSNSRRMEAVWTRLEQVKVTLESNPTLPAVPSASLPLRLPARGVHSSPNPSYQPVNSERQNAPMVPSQQENSSGVNGTEKEPEGLLEGTKVHQGCQFAVNYYRQYQVIPQLQTIMTAAACSKTLASKARKRAEVELHLTTTSED